MTKEELIGKLQMVYVGDKNALNELIGYYDGLKQGIDELQQENQELKDNWNKLKEYCKNNYYGTTTIGILDKMRELQAINKQVEELGWNNGTLGAFSR